MPTGATDVLRVLFENQFPPLHSVYMDDADFDRERGIVRHLSFIVSCLQLISYSDHRLRYGLQ